MQPTQTIRPLIDAARSVVDAHKNGLPMDDKIHLLECMTGSLCDDQGRPFIIIPLSVAATVDKAFLPQNPNKLRTGGEVVKEAAHLYRNAVLTALLQERG